MAASRLKPCQWACQAGTNKVAGNGVYPKIEQRLTAIKVHSVSTNQVFMPFYTILRSNRYRKRQQANALPLPLSMS